MRTISHAIRCRAPLAATLIALGLVGCGSSTNTASRTGTAPRLPPITKVVSVRLTSSAIHGAKLPVVYTCDGRNVAPPLAWGTLASDIEELALFAIDVTPSHSGRPPLTVEWAMAGVSPKLRHLSAGEVPRGAFLVQDSDGKRSYSICPAKGEAERYEFALYALPPGVRAGPGITGVRLLHNLTGTNLGGRSPATGEFSATYTRR